MLSVILSISVTLFAACIPAYGLYICVTAGRGVSRTRVLTNGRLMWAVVCLLLVSCESDTDIRMLREYVANHQYSEALSVADRVLEYNGKYADEARVLRELSIVGEWQERIQGLTISRDYLAALSELHSAEEVEIFATAAQQAGTQLLTRIQDDAREAFESSNWPALYATLGQMRTLPWQYAHGQPNWAELAEWEAVPAFRAHTLLKLFEHIDHIPWLLWHHCPHLAGLLGSSEPQFTNLLERTLQGHYGPSCFTPIQELNNETGYDTLMSIRTACVEYMRYSLAPAANVQTALSTRLPQMIDEIERSPQHRLRVALETCDQYVRYVRAERARIQRLARSGSEDAVYRGVARMERELERTWQPRLDAAFTTIQRSLSEPDTETYQQTMGRARLYREVALRCQP